MAEVFKCGDIANIINDNNSEDKKNRKKKRKSMNSLDKVIEENKDKVIQIQKKTVVHFKPSAEVNEESDEESNDSDNESQRNDRKKGIKRKAKETTEKTERTVFVGNLPKNITTKKLKKTFSKSGKIQSVRLRGAVPQKEKMTKKIAVITKSFHSGKDNINGYIVFASKESVFKALELNGSVIDGHRIRVDRAVNAGAHDQLRSVFVGNLPFVVKEDDLYEFFSDCGDIDAVRVVRDSATGVGKGFGFVSFKSKDSVVLALEKNEQKLNGRQLRVIRAKTENNKTKEKPKKRKKEIPNESQTEKKPNKKLKKSDSKPEFVGIAAKKSKRKIKKKKEINSLNAKKKQKKLAKIFAK